MVLAQGSTRTHMPVYYGRAMITEREVDTEVREDITEDEDKDVEDEVAHWDYRV